MMTEREDGTRFYEQSRAAAEAFPKQLQGSIDSIEFSHRHHDFERLPANELHIYRAVCHTCKSEYAISV